MPLEMPKLARITSTEKIYAASGGITAGEDRISVLSRKLGATSARSSQSAEYSDTDDGP